MVRPERTPGGDAGVSRPADHPAHERVLIGSESSRPGAFGGFHHPDQGYRHFQMMSVITMYGPMDRRSPEDPASALLDLLRAYTHDCLHYGSRRRYVEVAGVPVRTQYGINYRRTGGQSYSAADRHESRSTRNLGIVMEGACDKEARALTYRDATGTLTAEDTDRSATVPGSEEQARYMAALSGYERAVITGDATALGMWLDDRHGPGSFAGLFRTPEYFDA